MNERDGFLNALAQDENNTLARLVFADWLDEQGEHEEADRQRKWSGAKEWLIRLSQESSQSYEPFSYEDLIKFGYRVTKDSIHEKRIYVDSETLWAALQPRNQEFWTNWAIITGQRLPPGLEEEGFHSWACCSHEVYHWFGLPDPSDPEESEAS